MALVGEDVASMTTISASTTLGIVLNPTSYSNPVVVEAGVTISKSSGGSAVVGNHGSSGSFIIQNYGVIAAPVSGYVAGVSLAPGGSVTNAAAGTITGGYFGVMFSGGLGTVVNDGSIAATRTILNTVEQVAAVYLSAGGSVINGASASITVGLDGGSGSLPSGVRIGGADGLVVNSGRIADTGADGIGVEFFGTGGSITNAASATIFGDGWGILIAKPGTVVNHGSIAAGVNQGIAFDQGGAVTNSVSAVIIGGTGRGNAGIFVFGGAGSVVNDGSITDAGTFGDGIILEAGGSVTNATSGSITGGYRGLIVTGGAGTVVNQGSIWDTGTAGMGPVLLYHGGIGVDLTSGGQVANATSASITGGYRGVYITGGAGLVINEGSIAALSTTAGIAAIAVDLTSGGMVTNAQSASIMGNIGVLVGNTGTVVNHGTIDGSGTNGQGVFLSNGPVTNAALALITGGADGVSIGNGTVVNAGSIAGTGASTSAGGVNVAGFSVNNLVTNAASASISGNNGVLVAAGNVINDGSITGTGTPGAGVMLKSSGLVTNGALASITGAFDGVRILYDSSVQTGAGTVFNNGTIGGAGSSGRGIYILTGGRVRSGLVSNAASAVITGGSIGVELKSFITAGAATLINDGSVIGAGTASLGVDLTGGGSVTNTATASITGTDGVDVSGGTGTVVNEGSVVGSGTAAAFSGSLDHNGRGVYLKSGGLVTNSASAFIGGGYIGVEMGGLPSASMAAMVNFGTVAGMGAYGLTAGVVLTAGGSVTNAISGVFSGSVNIEGGTGTLLNDGSIAGGPDSAVYLAEFGSVSNGAFGSIAGGRIGVDLYAGGTLTNAGTITAIGTAVAFYGTGSNLLVLDPGFAFSGPVDGSAYANNTLELASAASAGTVAGLGTQFLNFGPIAFDAGAEWFIGGNTTGLAGTISGFAFGDTIEVTGITATGSSYVGGVLTLNEASGSVELRLPGSFSTSDFVVTNVAAGADVSLAAPCFVAGTRIRTERGAITVETLKKGDQVPVVTGGKPQPIVWLGHRRVDCKRHPNPKQVWPVCLTRNAFGHGRPFRDLWLSPDHALFIDGALIPIRYLANGRTIFQQARDEVTYWHVELAEHNVLYAEGVPVESYLDTGNRSAFANGGAAIDLHADFVCHIWETKSYAPLVLRGPKLATAKRRLLAQAAALGLATTRDPSLTLSANGKPLKAEVDGRTWRVRLPKAARSVRLISRVWNPAHMEPDANDARSLGVAISQLRLDGREIELDDPRLTRGWHAPEQVWRWTDGDGWIGTEDAHDLAFEVPMTGSYWWDEVGEQAGALSGA